MNTSTTEFFQNNEIDGALTPEQAAELMALAESGDTGAKPDTGGAPTTTTEPTDDAPAQPAKEVLMAKDGVHTIPFERLAEARTSAQQWQAHAEAAQLELEALRAESQARADSGQAPTRTDNMVAAAEAAIDAGADPADFGDFSEEALVQGINKTVSNRVRSEVQAAVVDALATMQKQKQEQERLAKQEMSEVELHHGAILKAHPDAGSVVQSAELESWVKAQPSYAQSGIRQVLQEGSTSQVIELIDSFKTATGKTQASAKGSREAAQAAIQRAADTVPNSLSDIPGGHAGGLSAHERLSSMEPADMGLAMEDMTPEQITRYLNRTG